MNGAPGIGWWQLALASVLLFASAGLSLLVSVGLARSLVWAGVRAVVQLTLLGMALRWIFDVFNPWLVVGFIALMCLVAAQTVRGRVKGGGAVSGIYRTGLFSLVVPAAAVTFLVTGGVIGADPWYAPRLVLPIAGMVVGNAMNATAVALDRLFSDLKNDGGRIRALLALGARPWEAALPSVRDALRAGMIPTLNSMSAAGVVFIPGMMTGQILSGTDPVLAARYQVVILVMISAATALGSALAVLLGYRKAFDQEERFLLDRWEGAAG